MTVRDAIDALLAFQRACDGSLAHMETLKQELGRFAQLDVDAPIRGRVEGVVRDSQGRIAAVIAGALDVTRGQSTTEVGRLQAVLLWAPQGPSGGPPAAGGSGSQGSPSVVVASIRGTVTADGPDAPDPSHEAEAASTFMVGKNRATLRRDATTRRLAERARDKRAAHLHKVHVARERSRREIAWMRRVEQGVVEVAEVLDATGGVLGALHGLPPWVDGAGGLGGLGASLTALSDFLRLNSTAVAAFVALALERVSFILAHGEQ